MSTSAAGRVHASRALRQAAAAVALQFPGDTLLTGVDPAISAGAFPPTRLPDLGSDIVVFEFFSGLHTWPVALSDLGYHVSFIAGCELDAAARRLGRHHLSVARATAPAGATPSLPDGVFDLPHNICDVQVDDLVRTGRLLHPNLIVCGSWPCQHRSMAGLRAGIASPMSDLAAELRRVISDVNRYRLAHRQPPVPCFLENVHVTALHPPEVQQDQARVRRLLGVPVVCDAARFGSNAHRVRELYTNVVPPAHLQRVLDAMERPPGLFLQDVLDPGRDALPVLRPEFPSQGRYVCNTVGAPRLTVPTLVSRPWSYAFRGPDAVSRGSVVLGPDSDADVQLGGRDGLPTIYHELNADERERAMGFTAGATCAADTSERQRRHAQGQSCDMNMLRGVLAAAVAPLHRWWQDCRPTTCHFWSTPCHPICCFVPRWRPWRWRLWLGGRRRRRHARRLRLGGHCQLARFRLRRQPNMPMCGTTPRCCSTYAHRPSPPLWSMTESAGASGGVPACTALWTTLPRLSGSGCYAVSTCVTYVCLTPQSVWLSSATSTSVLATMVATGRRQPCARYTGGTASMRTSYVHWKRVQCAPTRKHSSFTALLG